MASAGTAGRGSGTLERVTVNLTPRAAKALDQAVKSTGDTKTDTINRALQVYAYLEETLQAGGSIYLRPDPDGELERLRIF
jgi:hypothetical protein